MDGVQLQAVPLLAVPLYHLRSEPTYYVVQCRSLVVKGSDLCRVTGEACAFPQKQKAPKPFVYGAWALFL